MSNKQKAIVCHEVGSDLSLELIDIPEPGPNEVLVKLHAIGLNSLDWLMRERGSFVKEWPAVFGFDAAGTVVKAGEAVTNVAVGDRVMHSGTLEEPQVFTFKEYTVIRSDFVAQVPANITLDEASTIPLALATGAFALYDSKHPPRGGFALTPPWEANGRGKYVGEPIVIVGGASSVGQFAIQFARLSGFSPIITTASKHNEAYLESLGATHVIDRALPLADLAMRVAAIAGRPVLYAFDAVSTPETQNAAYDLLAPAGNLIVDRRFEIEEAKLASGEKYVALVSGDAQNLPSRPCATALYAHMTELLATGDIKPNRIEVVPGGLLAVQAALSRLKEGVSALKLVIRPQETL
ncbi:zinc-binding alcohol dehydrogenase family protein [Phanerochaete sordida]|uniref:Zinc-binding alcohol dehydrogenase family protein n=1 Tax=Phanerochaete sordida TaxID=48140 RepID=A0A9P3G620_9APHY|nr:zinc-binding alcohol dehydrogenase family protein [Phanerochaete sordida]